MWKALMGNQATFFEGVIIRINKVEPANVLIWTSAGFPYKRLSCMIKPCGIGKIY